jgi:hypothetical protein
MTIHTSSDDARPKNSRRALVPWILGLGLIGLAALVWMIPSLMAEDPRLAMQQSLVGAWARGAALRPGASQDPDPFWLDAMRSLTIDSEGLSRGELAVTLTWSNGRTQRFLGYTDDMLPGHVRIDGPHDSQLIVSMTPEGIVSIDDGFRAFPLERQ